MLEGLQWRFCTRCKHGSIFPTCSGFGFYGPLNTFYAHARYLVMVSRRFFNELMKNTIYIHAPREQTQKHTNYCSFRDSWRMHKNPVHAQESCVCTRILCMHKNSVHAQDFSACTRCLSMEFYEFNRFIMLNYIDNHLIMNFMTNMFRAKPGPNRSSRPLNTQLLLEMSIRIQWKTSQTPQKSKKKNKNPSLLSP